MTRVSPPELARELPGPQASTRVTRAPRRSSMRAVHPPNAPAPTTTTDGFAPPPGFAEGVFEGAGEAPDPGRASARATEATGRSARSPRRERLGMMALGLYAPPHPDPLPRSGGEGEST